MTSTAECCVPQCTNTGGHRFPWSNRTLMEKWIKAVRRDEWDPPAQILAAHYDGKQSQIKIKGPSKYTLVCSSHFDETDFPSWTYEGTKPLIKRLRKGSVPHIFPWKATESDSAKHRRERGLKRRREEEDRDSAFQEIGALESVVCEEPVHDFICLQEPSESTSSPAASRDHSTQSEARRISIQDFMSDAEGLHHYTGMEDYNKFMLVFNCLGETVNNLVYYFHSSPVLPPVDQFLVTVMKLRYSLDDFEICRKFVITKQILSNIFITWINFLCLQFEEFDFWTEKDLVHFYSPSDFFHKYPTTRSIMDGTECPIQKPKQPLAQQATFSSYKNKNTAKVVVGVSPGGLINYCSEAYGGSASDRQIVERSDLTNMCEPGDSIMADKGFNVQDLFESKDVLINIPTFFKKKNRISNKTVKTDRQIASKRVHVERIIGLAKTFKILKHPLNNTQSALASQIVKVCFYLCNFKKCIVSKVA